MFTGSCLVWSPNSARILYSDQQSREVLCHALCDFCQEMIVRCCIIPESERGDLMNSKPPVSYRNQLIPLIVVLCLCSAPLFAQHATSTAQENQALARATNSGTAYAVLVDGLGTYSRRISTKSEMAQKFFDQGLRLVYGYYSPEAAASFREAIRHDNNHPMPYWGLALTLGPIPNSRFLGFPDDPKEEGRKAMAAARERAANGSPAEQALIEALAVRYDTERYLDRDLRDAKYIEATQKLFKQYPNDLEAGYLYADALMTHAAWSYWKRDGSPLPGTREAVRALEHVMSKDPNHPGAVHLYIHLFESSAEPERALPQARRLESLMPKAGHLVHMPSHIYVRTGFYDEAVLSNQRSLAADGVFKNAWGDRATPSLGTYGMSSLTHARHAWDFLRYAAMHQGNYARAIEAAKAASAGSSHQGMGGVERAGSTIWLINKVFGKWAAVLAEPEPHGSAYLRGLWHYVRGSAFVGRGELDKAEEELKELKTLAVDPSVKELLTVANPAPTVLQLSVHGLSGEILSTRARHNEAINEFREAVKLQDTLKYVEPPDWGQSMRLYLGAALLKAGRAKEAEAIYREDLRDFRNDGWALFGLVQSLEAQKKTGEARKAKEEFNRAWKNADVTLTASVF